MIKESISFRIYSFTQSKYVFYLNFNNFLSYKLRWINYFKVTSIERFKYYKLSQN